jgi:ubiquinone/menaquinone biosynthesis C-methylase UbiE
MWHYLIFGKIKNENYPFNLFSARYILTMSCLFSAWDDELYYKVRKFLSKRLSFQDSKAILNILTGDKSDTEKVKMSKLIAEKEKKGNEGREGSRIDDILHILPEEIKISDYLDVGCGEGSISSAMTKQFNLDSNHSFACDIIDQKVDGSFNFTLSTDFSLPYQDNTFDLVTLFMTGHHLSDPERMIPEIRRVMKKTGFLVMRDHNAVTDKEKLFLDIVHCLYACVFSDETKPEDCNGKYATYRSTSEFLEMFNKFGFKCLKVYQKNDMFSSFYSLFVQL